ncbi:hypothetical protein GDO81_015775 [Engystomops pustulosus]|uniref:Secreted protein n=1 Tax=Engystomops pustulosus TaxID=76066 RepID=A0AAV7AV28_ENGPU|nr:hypothetical protein GDO81_015775 [Engystomops pustulosus]
MRHNSLQQTLFKWIACIAVLHTTICNQNICNIYNKKKTVTDNQSVNKQLTFDIFIVRKTWNGIVACRCNGVHNDVSRSL